MRLGPGSTLFLSLGSSVVVSNFHLHLRLSRSSIAQCSSLFGWHGHGELLTTLQLATLQCLRWSRRLIPTQHPFGFKFNSAGLSRPHNTHRARPDRPFGYVSPARSNEISSARRVNRHQARLRQIKLAPTIRRIQQPPGSVHPVQQPPRRSFSLSACALARPRWRPGKALSAFQPLSWRSTSFGTQPSPRPVLLSPNRQLGPNVTRHLGMLWVKARVAPTPQNLPVKWITHRTTSTLALLGMNFDFQTCTKSIKWYFVQRVL